jgi:hypothetical protein
MSKEGPFLLRLKNQLLSIVYMAPLANSFAKCRSSSRKYKALGDGSNKWIISTNRVHRPCWLFLHTIGCLCLLFLLCNWKHMYTLYTCITVFFWI